ncbi:MAG: hypothetical protein ABIA78_01350, partial [archaeon]
MGKGFIILGILFLVLINSVSAVPFIGNAPNSIADGQSVMISGNGFGTNALDIEWLGGAGGNIEQGTIDVEISLPAGWTADTTSVNFQRPIYSDTRAHSRSQTIKSYFPETSQYGSGYFYNYGSAMSSVYVSWWVYVENLSCLGDCPYNAQWKVLRITPGVGNIYGDQPQGWYWSQQLAAPTATFVGQDPALTNNCLDADLGGQYDENCYAGVTEVYRQSGVNIVEDGWHRVEVWTEESSPGSQDGTIIVGIFNSTNAIRYYANYDKNTRTRTDASPQWQYVVFQNYMGNGLNVGDIYQDDFFMQFGSQARVELCDTNVWSARIHCEIQPPTSWLATGDLITININQGSFNDGEQAYLFVVDENGDASNGYG